MIREYTCKSLNFAIQFTSTHKIIVEGSASMENCQQELLQVKQVAKMIGRCEHTIYRWIKGGKIPFIKFGSTYYIPREVFTIPEKKLSM